MLFYIFFSSIVAIIAGLAQWTNVKVQSNILAIDTNHKNYYGVFYFLLIGVIVFVTGFRYNVGSDFFAYYAPKQIPLTKIVEDLKLLNVPAMKILSNLSIKLWDNPQSLIFFSSTISILLFFYGISKFDENDIGIFVLLYLYIGGWLFLCNGIRQAVAVSIVFAFSYAYQQHGLKSILSIIIVVFIAFMFHKSALMMMPIIFLSKRRIDFKQFIIILVTAIVIPYLYDGLFEFMDTNITDEEALLYIEKGINPIRVVVAFAPLALILFVDNKKAFLEKNNFVTNLVLFNAILFLVTSKSAYLNRFTKFTTIYVVLFVPAALKYIENNNLRIILKWITVALYFSYWLYEISNGAKYLPFKFGFNYM